MESQPAPDRPCAPACKVGGHGNGALLVAGLIGGLTGSWAIFGLALAGMVITKLIGGDIRLHGRKR